MCAREPRPASRPNISKAWDQSSLRGATFRPSCTSARWSAKCGPRNESSNQPAAPASRPSHPPRATPQTSPQLDAAACTQSTRAPRSLPPGQTAASALSYPNRSRPPTERPGCPPSASETSPWPPNMAVHDASLKYQSTASKTQSLSAGSRQVYSKLWSQLEQPRRVQLHHHRPTCCASRY